MNTTTRNYSELSKLQTFRERYEYLRLSARVGETTFGFDRYLNQIFYKSPEWKSVRAHVILRDEGCDLGIPGYEIYGKVLIHHMNPISISAIKERSDFLFDPEFLITVSHDTHNAIHYGNENILPAIPIERTENDTCPWK